jgi:hypothetical protein
MKWIYDFTACVLFCILIIAISFWFAYALAMENVWDPLIKKARRLWLVL